MGDKANTWRDITKRAWEEPAFKERLLGDPDGVLKEYGITREQGVNYRVIEDEPGVRTLVLMQPPGNVAVTDVDHEPLSDENPGF